MNDVDTTGPTGPTSTTVPRPRGRRWIFAAVAAALGAGLAGAYAYFIGCKTGGCPLTSNVWTASLYGSVVGLIIGWPGRGGKG